MPAIDSNHSYASRPPRREPAPPPPMPRAPVGAPLRGGLAPGPSPRQVAHPSFPRALPQQPFRPAQQQAQRRVERAAVALPKQPTPIIPHVANPTPRQTHVALQLVRSQIGRILGPNPTTQRLASFQQELANDPRQRPFLQSVQHYVDAAEGHLRAELQRHPLQRYNAQLEASTPTLQQYRAEGIPGLLREQAREHEGSGPLPTIASINLNKLVAGLANAHVAPGGNLLSKLANEAFDLPAQSFLSSELLGAQTRQDVERGQIGKGLLEVPKAFGQGVVGAVEHPLRTPLVNALMLGGAEAGVAGAAARGVAALGSGLSAGERLAALAKPALTPRPDLRLYGESGVTGGPAGAGFAKLQGERITGRSYNPDPLRAALQKGYERTLTSSAVPERLRQADPFQASGWRLQRNLVGGVTKIGRLDRVAAAMEDNRRVFVKGTTRHFEGFKPGDHTRDLVPLIVQRAIRSPRTVLEDAQKVRDMWVQHQPGLVGSQLKRNKANIAALDRVLADPAFRANPQAATADAFRAAAEHLKLSHPFTGEKVYAQRLSPDQLRAGLFPYAITHMGAVQGDIVPPDALAAHEESQAAHADAQAALRDAEARVKQAENARSRLIGEGTARPVAARGRALQDRLATSGGGTARDAAEARLRGAKERLRVAQSNARDAAGNRLAKPRPVPGLRSSSGGYLSNEEILAHMRAAGVEPPGFISHKAGIGGSGSFWKSWMRAVPQERFTRTGEAFRTGVADHSWEAGVGSLAKQASEAAQLASRRSVFKRFAIGGAYTDEKAARAAADNFNAGQHGEDVTHGLGEVVPVHIGQHDIASGRIAPRASAADTLAQFGLHEHTPVEAADAGKYVLMPKAVIDRLTDHENAISTRSGSVRLLQRYQQGFRHAKLNTSVPHIAGVVQEQAIRLGSEFNDPISVALADRVGQKVTRNLRELAQLDKHGTLVDSHGPNGERFRELASAFANRGGQAGSQRWTDAYRKANALGDVNLSGYLLHGASTAGHSGLGTKLGAPWRAWKLVVEGGLAKVEHGTRNALLAKALRETGMIDSFHQVLGMQDQAVKDLIAGKFNANSADRLAEAIDNMGGNWNRQTPAVRKAVANVMPFGLWWLNSMRWLYRMPVTHPVKTGILAALYQATREQRNAKGQGYDAAHPVPNFLQGTIDATLPLLGKGKVAPTYYSPGGTLGPEAGTTLADLAFPQFSGLASIARDQNPLSGARLTSSDKRELLGPQALLNVAGEAVAGPTPFATQAQKLLTMGGKPYGTANLLTEIASKLGGPSQVKPGTERSLQQVLGKLISPTRFDFPSTGGTGKGGLGPIVSPGAGLSPRQRLAVPRQGGGSGLSLRQQLQQSQQRGGSSGGLSLRQRLALGQRANSAYLAPGVEPGVSGKELLFQHNRAFGPGPIRPFIEPPPAARAPRTNVVPLSPNGVYRGGRRPQPLGPGSKGHARRRFAPVV